MKSKKLQDITNTGKTSMSLGLPKMWGTLPGADKAICIFEVKVSRGSKLVCKVLVFHTIEELEAFQKANFPETDGNPTGLAEENEHWKCGGYCCELLRGEDERVFAWIGLIVTQLKAESIVHESVHAGCAYVRRARGVQWPGQEFNDEERVCYPVGRIAASIFRGLRGEGLIV